MKNATIRYVIASNVERLLRAAPGIGTELELATRAGIRQSTVRSILRGSVDADVDTLDAIARALNVSARALLASPATLADPLAIYRDRIAALPADQQQRIQNFINLVPAQHEEHAAH